MGAANTLANILIFGGFLLLIFSSSLKTSKIGTLAFGLGFILAGILLIGQAKKAFNATAATMIGIAFLLIGGANLLQFQDLNKLEKKKQTAMVV